MKDPPMQSVTNRVCQSSWCILHVMYHKFSLTSNLSRLPDVFENLSISVKKERHQSAPDTLQDKEEPSDQVTVAEKQSKLFEVGNREEYV